MGEIIQFDFNKNRRIEVDEKIKDSEIPEIFEAPQTSEIIIDNKDKMKEDDILFKKFVHFVISDRHKKFKNLEIKQMPYNEAKNLVSDYTNEQLINWIVNSDESEWVVRPSFYMAIYDEIKSRLPERFNK